MTIISLFIFGNIACKEQPQNMPEKITIAYPLKDPLYSLPYIALEKGFFADEGLNVSLQDHEYGKLALQSLIDGKADLAISAQTPFMFAISAGKKASMIAVIASSGKSTGIIARKDRGIVSPEDLRGKRIGVTLGTVGEFSMDLFFSVRGITRNEMVVVDLKPDQIIDAMLNDKIDAAAIWHPVLIQLQQKLGNNGVLFYDMNIIKDLACLSASQEIIGKAPEALKKILKALIRAKEFVKKNPDEFYKLESEHIQMDINMLKQMLNVSYFSISLEQSLIVELEDQTRWAIKSGLTSRPDMPNYYDFIYADALKSVKPEAVSLMR
jgi:NitT/TauT family transport system substrate-binding protein